MKLLHRNLSLWLSFVLFLSIASVWAQSYDPVSLPKMYKAPELTGLNNWINSGPIKSMNALKGKVVLIDFWTYSCYNCVNTIPHIKAWHEKYKDRGLVVLGIHTPEFIHEYDLNNVKESVKKRGITFPVVLDNEFKFWQAYNNRYWPAFYLVDKSGVVRYTHFGEGRYKETEAAIITLLHQKL